ncbi:sulfate ABC transporter, ATP-binding protein [Beggiatoa alba B18LD]|uniref:Sulfate ABC transporter, ATP-binding protein n=1 Tax=Beggiatoa alba B18LD TaxID=395493 RepID=I3CKP7_9GAMM|nr:sulfate/molybdate ABC transporter ATP-binding protein [Beggiatoa alba]EIJ44190.1 sulfate ABC transporter, ATP-binding protein [Beggiatoa alba B18LD]
MSITIQNIQKTFNQYQALKSINLEVPTGELVALLGPSGCGKTTLLRIIAGLETPDSGNIYFHGEETTSQPVQERQVGFVFQHYALFRHLTVFENVAFGLRVRPRHSRPPKAEIRKRVESLLKLVQLHGLADRYPRQLSGGQRQRVALARALAVEPKVLLLDEPFGALDANVRKELRRWLRQLHDEIHLTSVFVTHDQEEAMEVSDSIVVMNQGKIEQIGTPNEIYEHPANPFVYQFLGNVNLFHGRLQNGTVHVGDAQIPLNEHHHIEQSETVAYVRPHELEITRAPHQSALEAIITTISKVGSSIRLELHRPDDENVLQAELSKGEFEQLSLQKGEKVFIKPKQMRVFL